MANNQRDMVKDFYDDMKEFTGEDYETPKDYNGDAKDWDDMHDED